MGRDSLEGERPGCVAKDWIPGWARQAAPGCRRDTQPPPKQMMQRHSSNRTCDMHACTRPMHTALFMRDGFCMVCPPHPPIPGRTSVTSPPEPSGTVMDSGTSGWVATGSGSRRVRPAFAWAYRFASSTNSNGRVMVRKRRRERSQIRAFVGVIRCTAKFDNGYITVNNRETIGVGGKGHLAPMKPPFVIRRLLDLSKERPSLSTCIDGSGQGGSLAADQEKCPASDGSGMQDPGPQTPGRTGIQVGAEPVSGPSDDMGSHSGPNAASRHPPMRCRSYYSPMGAPSLDAPAMDGSPKTMTQSAEIADLAGQPCVRRISSLFMDVSLSQSTHAGLTCPMQVLSAMC